MTDLNPLHVKPSDYPGWDGNRYHAMDNCVDVRMTRTVSVTRVCGARNKRYGKAIRPAKYPYCQHQRLMVNGRCFNHGGRVGERQLEKRVLRGDLRDYIPVGKLKDIYTEVMEAGDVQSMRQWAAFWEARGRQLVAQIDQGESGSLWGDLAAADRAMAAAQDRAAYCREMEGKLINEAEQKAATGDTEGAAALREHAAGAAATAGEQTEAAGAAFKQIRDLIRRGANQVDIYKELAEAAKQKILASDAELRRLDFLHGSVPVDQYFALLTMLGRKIGEALQPGRSLEEMRTGVGMAIRDLLGQTRQQAEIVDATPVRPLTTGLATDGAV